MSFMDEMAAFAAAMLASDMLTGAVITRTVKGVFDPVTGTVITGGQTIPCRAVAAPIKIVNANGAREAGTGLTLDTEVISGDIVTIGGSSFTVGEVQAIAPHGTPLLWKAVVA